MDTGGAAADCGRLGRRRGTTSQRRSTPTLMHTRRGTCFSLIFLTRFYLRRRKVTPAVGVGRIVTFFIQQRIFGIVLQRQLRRPVNSCSDETFPARVSLIERTY